MKNILIFSPNRYSLYSIAVTELLRRRGIRVQAIVIRRMVNPARFLSEFRRDGTRLLRKVWRKLLLRERAYSTQHFETLSGLMSRESISQRSLYDFNSQFGIPVISCWTLNDIAVVDALEELKPDLIVFTGGGLIRGQVLARAGKGILNCHTGILPEYRGMDVVEWALLEARPDLVGVTVHCMDARVDTGDILRTRRVEAGQYASIRQLRDRLDAIMCEELVATCCDFLDDHLIRKPQRPEDGRQYFVMHPRLIRLAEEKFQVTKNERGLWSIR